MRGLSPAERVMLSVRGERDADDAEVPVLMGLQACGRTRLVAEGEDYVYELTSFGRLALRVCPVEGA